MAQAVSIFAQFLKQAFGGAVNLNTDTLKMGLLGTGYTPNLTSDTHWSDISSHEIPATGGYTAGGVALSGASLTLTAANAWATTWVASTNYSYGQIVRPAAGNGFLYRAVQAGSGTSGSSAPAFPTVTGETVTDGSVTWACLGDAILVFTSSAAAWSPLTASNIAYAVLYDTQSGTPSAEPLIVLNTFAAPQSPSGVPFTVSPDPVLGWMCYSPPS